MNKYENKEALLDINAIAEQWVNLIFTHLDYKRHREKRLSINKKENENE